ncbi:MAG TPA: sugar transferase [Solirubrobacteraceae bacterium]|jgi:exopolysaccharide biosynthesis polyprenyl glycosylphosphotransferase|nr:sugar transferase [Solirubrobacteraceae bacterium]
MPQTQQQPREGEEHRQQIPPPPADFTLGDRDVRRKRPPVLSFLLRLDTLRKALRLGTLLTIDFFGVYMAIITALWLKAGLTSGEWRVSAQSPQTAELFDFAYLVTVLLFARSGLYAARGERPGMSRIVSSLFQVMLVALIFAVASGHTFSSYYIFYGSLFFAAIYVSLLRLGYEKFTGALLRLAGYQRRAVLVGSGEHIEAVGHALRDAATPTVKVVGFMSLTPRPNNGLLSLGTLDELAQVIHRHRIDEVIIADPDFPQTEAVEVVEVAHAQGVRVRIAPSTMELLVHRAEFVPGEAVPLFELKPPVFEGFDYVLKRTFDLVGASLLLLALSPVLAAAALAVRISSRGPILYCSMRPGIGGVPFACLKFRTMYRDADQRQADLESLNEASGALFKMRDDPRMTPVGRFLRRYSIDELPQLFNVLRGEMSLVGPRPLPERDFQRLEEWHKKRYLVTPGITGLWQVSGRSELDFDDLVRLDFLYLERWSVFLDLSILVKTVPAVFSRRGAF